MLGTWKAREHSGFLFASLLKMGIIAEPRTTWITTFFAHLHKYILRFRPDGFLLLQALNSDIPAQLVRIISIKQRLVRTCAWFA